MPLSCRCSAEIGFALDIDQPGLPKRRRGGDAHRLAKKISADFHQAQSVDLAGLRTFGIDQQSAFGDHLANFGFDQIVALDSRLARHAQVRGRHRRFAGLPRDIAGFARQVGQVHETRGDLVAAARQAHAVFDHRRDGGAVEGAKAFVLAEFVQPAAVLADDVVVHLHLFVELDAHLENLLELLFVGVEHFVKIAIADEDDLHSEVDRLGLERRGAEGKKQLHGLDFELGMIQRALECAPDAHFGRARRART